MSRMENGFTPLNCSARLLKELKFSFFAFSIFVWMHPLITRIFYLRIPFKRWRFLCISRAIESIVFVEFVARIETFLVHKLLVRWKFDWNRVDICNKFSRNFYQFILLFSSLVLMLNIRQITLRKRKWQNESERNRIFAKAFREHIILCCGTEETMVDGKTSRQVSRQSTELIVANRRRKKAVAIFIKL